MPARLVIPLLSLTAAGIMSLPAYAENPVGRYEMVTLPSQPGSYDRRVMILDTADGHLWQWWEAPAVGGSAPSSGITYLGKVAPGAAAGETVPTHRSGAPEPILPHRRLE